MEAMFDVKRTQAYNKGKLVGCFDYNLIKWLREEEKPLEEALYTVPPVDFLCYPESVTFGWDNEEEPI